MHHESREDTYMELPFRYIENSRISRWYKPFRVDSDLIP